MTITQIWVSCLVHQPRVRAAATTAHQKQKQQRKRLTKTMNMYQL
jgi:hemoglobin-like flavoprotein